MLTILIANGRSSNSSCLLFWIKDHFQNQSVRCIIYFDRRRRLMSNIIYCRCGVALLIHCFILANMFVIVIFKIFWSFIWIFRCIRQFAYFATRFFLFLLLLVHLLLCVFSLFWKLFFPFALSLILSYISKFLFNSYRLCN